jgi:hypothetical protein
VVPDRRHDRDEAAVVGDHAPLPHVQQLVPATHAAPVAVVVGDVAAEDGEHRIPARRRAEDALIEG